MEFAFIVNGFCIRRIRTFDWLHSTIHSRRLGVWKMKVFLACTSSSLPATLILVGPDPPFLSLSKISSSACEQLDRGNFSSNW
ncbi:hypothetical protein NC651_003671 [Populus alba x Populus x berolinensis]|nr:hypothetical protein NC651_003671 [Populus alba x Populus x berolinensis]